VATRRGEAREGGSRHGRWQPGGSGNGSHAGEAGEEREKGRWLSGGTDPTVGPSGSEKGGMTGGLEPRKEKKRRKENRLNSNLKLILKIYSNLI
jgi:hypothetical protein